MRLEGERTGKRIPEQVLVTLREVWHIYPQSTDSLTASLVWYVIEILSPTISFNQVFFLLFRGRCWLYHSNWAPGQEQLQLVWFTKYSWLEYEKVQDACTSMQMIVEPFPLKTFGTGSLHWRQERDFRMTNWASNTRAIHRNGKCLWPPLQLMSNCLSRRQNKSNFPKGKQTQHCLQARRYCINSGPSEIAFQRPSWIRRFYQQRCFQRNYLTGRKVWWHSPQTPGSSQEKAKSGSQLHISEESEWNYLLSWKRSQRSNFKGCKWGNFFLYVPWDHSRCLQTGSDKCHSTVRW